MTLWARLTWQVPDPGTFAPILAGRLGTTALEQGDDRGSWTIALAGGLLEIRPWVRESPTDEPVPGGRLVLEPVVGGEEAPVPVGGALTLAGIGWATVELDRAEAELEPWLGEATEAPAAHGSLLDPHLGAYARVRGGGGLPGEAVVLLEPSTEGRLSATLARDGEGPAAIYLRPAGGLATWLEDARARGIPTSSRATGPLGPAVLLLGGPVAGPHLLLVDTPRASNGAFHAGTIAS